MVKISIVIVARDEEVNLQQLLPTLGWADEVIVQIDDRTKDHSFEVAGKLGAKVFKEHFTDFSQFKNAAISRASSRWVFLLDADERISPDLRREVAEVIQAEKAAAYEMPFKNFLGGHWLAHGGLYPDYHTRLFQKELATYQGAVHERLKIRGSTGQLRGAVEHYTYRNRAELAAKVDFYSALEARVVKRNYTLALVRAVLRFIKVYLLQLGILDGLDGLANAWQLGRYQWRVYTLGER